MKLLSLSAYGKTHGASRQAATKWRDKGVLVMKGANVDADKSDGRMRDAGLGRFKKEAEEAQPRRATARRNQRRPAAATAAAIDEAVTDLEAAGADGEIDLEQLSDFMAGLLEGRFQSKANAAAIKENALALKHLLAAQRDAGLLVELETAESVIFEDRRKARDAWLNWPVRIGPLLAADLGIEDAGPLVEALKRNVHEQLEQLGEPHLDFRAGPDE